MARLAKLRISAVRLFGLVDHVPLLNVCQLELEGGVVYGVAGPSLSGRSALLRFIGGGSLALSRDSHLGEAKVDWIEPLLTADFDAKHHSAYIGPDPRHSLSGLTTTVREELDLHGMLGAERQGGRSSCNPEDMASLFGLQEVLGQNPVELSGGQTASLALICGILMDRPILCVDEALAHLDVQLRPRAWMRIKQFVRRGKIALVSDNSYDLMAEYADQVMTMADKEIRVICSPSAAFSNGEQLRSRVIPTVTRLACEIGIDDDQLPTRYAELREVLKRRIRAS